MYETQKDPSPPPAAPANTYRREFLHCTRCNRLELKKPQLHPQGTASPCSGCEATGHLVSEQHDIRLAAFKVCERCRNLRVAVLFVPADVKRGDVLSCPNCSSPLTTSDAEREFFVVFRHVSHGTKVYQVIPRKGE